MNRGIKRPDPYLDADDPPPNPRSNPPTNPPVDDRPDPYAAAQARREREANRQAKRPRAVDPVTRARLGHPDFGVAQYVSHYGANFIDAWRFGRLRRGIGTDRTARFVTGRGVSCSTRSQYGCWKSRWEHIGNLVKEWAAPPNCDMPWARSVEEERYATAMAQVITNLVRGNTPTNYLEVDVFPRFPILVQMSCFSRGPRWVKDFEFETRYRLRFASGRVNNAGSFPHDIMVGWHNTEIHGMTNADRANLFPRVASGWLENLECSRYLCVPTPWVYLYFGSLVTHIDYKTGQTRDITSAEMTALVSRFEAQGRAEYCWFAFVRWVQLVFYGVSFRGFSDPGLRANNGRFTGVLTLLSPGVQDWVEHKGFGDLMFGSNLPTHLVALAFERMRDIDWSVFPTNAVTNNGPYFRYCAATGEIDTLPPRQAYVNNVLTNLASYEVQFRAAGHVSELMTADEMRGYCEEHYPEACYVNACTFDGTVADIHHRYRDGSDNFGTPYPSDWAVGRGRGVVTQGDPTYRNGYPVAHGDGATPRRAPETVPLLTTTTTEVVPTPPTEVPAGLVREEGDENDESDNSFFGRLKEALRNYCDRVGADVPADEASVLTFIANLSRFGEQEATVRLLSQQLTASQERASAAERRVAEVVAEMTASRTRLADFNRGYSQCNQDLVQSFTSSLNRFGLDRMPMNTAREVRTAIATICEANREAATASTRASDAQAEVDALTRQLEQRDEVLEELRGEIVEVTQTANRVVEMVHNVPQRDALLRERDDAIERAGVAEAEVATARNNLAAIQVEVANANAERDVANAGRDDARALVEAGGRIMAQRDGRARVVQEAMGRAASINRRLLDEMRRVRNGVSALIAHQTAMTELTSLSRDTIMAGPVNWRPYVDQTSLSRLVQATGGDQMIEGELETGPGPAGQGDGDAGGASGAAGGSGAGA